MLSLYMQSPGDEFALLLLSPQASTRLLLHALCIPAALLTPRQQQQVIDAAMLFVLHIDLYELGKTCPFSQPYKDLLVVSQHYPTPSPKHM